MPAKIHQPFMLHQSPCSVPGHAEDEGDAVSGQERARGPEDHVLAPERDPHLEHRAGQQRDEDLRDREPELERHLAEDLQRDDHGREVEPRVADARQQDRVGRASNPQGRLAGAGSAHRLMVCRCRSSPPDPNRLVDRRARLYCCPHDDRVPPRSALGRRALPADRAAGEGGAAPRPARRGRPAADRPRGRGGARDQPEHRCEGISRARDGWPRRGPAGAGHVHHRHARRSVAEASRGAPARARALARVGRAARASTRRASAP